MKIIALDLGSRSVKIAISDGFIIDYNIYDTSSFFSECGKPEIDGFKLDFDKFGLEKGARVFATGYGRNALSIASAIVLPEIQAHALGAIEQTGLKDTAVVDLGGQDSKIIWLENGRIRDFFMNDRCAASAGRYIENMASVLGMTLAEISNYYESPERLTTTCAVFGESEIVSKLARGADKYRLAAGVNLQIVNKISAKLANSPVPNIVLVGGVAKNSAIAKLLGQTTGVPVVIPKYPQFNAVIGLINHAASF